MLLLKCRYALELLARTKVAKLKLFLRHILNASIIMGHGALPGVKSKKGLPALNNWAWERS